MAESLLDTIPTETDGEPEAGAVIHLRPTYGVLQVSDSDRQDFLHRLTTNEINKLKPGDATVTIVTSPTARILFAFTVLVRQDDLLLLPGAGQTEALARHLRGQIFFMDSVKVADQSDEWQRLRLIGDANGEVLASLGFEFDDKVDDAWLEHAGVLVVKQTRYDVPGYEIVCSRAQSDEIIARLNDAGIATIDHAGYDRLRVMAGRPAAGSELIDVYNPLESGMAWICADDKGCYTGQEIIARQITYDKVTRTLVGIRSEQAIAQGADVLLDSRTVGSVTSVAQDLKSGDFMALALLKRPANETDTQVMIDGNPAVVTSLPFSNH